MWLLQTDCSYHRLFSLAGGSEVKVVEFNSSSVWTERHSPCLKAGRVFVAVRVGFVWQKSFFGAGALNCCERSGAWRNGSWKDADITAGVFYFALLGTGCFFLLFPDERKLFRLQSRVSAQLNCSRVSGDDVKAKQSSNTVATRA